MHRSLLARARRLVSAAGELIFHRQKPEKVGRRHAPDIKPYVAHILSDASLFNEIPSPTEHEEARVDFIVQRLSEFGYPGTECDENGNVTLIIPGREDTEDYTLLFAATRCEEFSPLESMTRLEQDLLRGRGISESAIPVASLLVLAECLAREGIGHGDNLILLFTPHDPTDLDSDALEAFLRQWEGKIRGAAFVSGLGLGNVDESPLGTCKLSVSVHTIGSEFVGELASQSAISAIAGMASRLGGIHWDEQNRTFLNIAKIDAGVGFGSFAADGMMEIEVFSPDAAALEVARTAAVATINAAASQSKATAEIAVMSYLPPVDPATSRELRETVRQIYGELRIREIPTDIPTTATLLSLKGIPAVTLGMANGKKSVSEEFVRISSLEAGFAQLLLFLDKCLARPNEDAS